jgi:hypothetical protein
MKRALAVVAFLLVCSVGLQAGIDYSFFCITSTGSDAQIGVDQLSVEVSDAGIILFEGQNRNSVAFTFTNVGDDASVISEIYFDDGSLLERATITSSAGVSFRTIYEGKGKDGPVNPDNLPGGNNVDPDFEATSMFSVEPENPQPNNGVGPDEWVAITYVLKENMSYSDIIDELNDGVDLRIGMHVIAFDSGSSESFVNNVPEPTTLAILGLGVLFLKRRKQ